MSTKFLIEGLLGRAINSSNGAGGTGSGFQSGGKLEVQGAMVLRVGDKATRADLSVLGVCGRLFHDRCERGVGLGPRILYRLRERIAESFFECPQ